MPAYIVVNLVFDHCCSSCWSGSRDTLQAALLKQVALVGAPNVGKSSLVALLSSGAPEVCDYPFTTRSIKMGHFFVSGRRHQVVYSLISSIRVPVSVPVATISSPLHNGDSMM